MYYLILMFLVILTSCASNEVKYDLNESTKPLHFYVSKIKNLNGTYRSIWYSTDPMKSCFEDAKPTDNIVTTVPHDISFVFRTVFYNHSTMNIKKITDSTNRSDEFVMEAYEDMKIEYDIAYCENTIPKFFKDENLNLVSYRITNIKK